MLTALCSSPPTQPLYISALSLAENCFSLKLTTILLHISQVLSAPPALSRMRTSAYVLSVFPLLCRQAYATAAGKACYFPDGTWAGGDYPCFPDQDVSICCYLGHTCMSNNICRWPDEGMPPPLAYIRGSCTDKTCKMDFPFVCRGLLPVLADYKCGARPCYGLPPYLLFRILSEHTGLIVTEHL